MANAILNFHFDYWHPSLSKLINDMLGRATLPHLSFSKWKRKVIRGRSYAQSSCFSFHGINPRTEHLVNGIHWRSSRSEEIWNERQSPRSTRLQGCPGAGIPFALLGGKPENHPFWYFPPNCNQFASVFSILLCLLSSFQTVFVREGSFRSCVPLEISWTGQCDASPTLVGASTIKVFSRSCFFLKTGIPSLDKSNPRKGLIFRDISYLRCIRIDATVEQSFQKPFLIIHR